MLQAFAWTTAPQSSSRLSSSMVKLAILGLLLSLAVPFVSRADDPPPAAAPTPEAPGESDTPALPPTEQALFDRINTVRSEHGLPPYILSPTLVTVARTHVEDMAARNWMSHTGSDGSGYRQRIARAQLAFTHASENVGMGFDLDRMFDWWMHSPVHRGAILGTQYTQIGLAHIGDPAQRYGHWWDIVFISPPNT